MRKLVNIFFWFVGVIVVAIVYFFVPVGRYTLFEHTMRISATEPAQELGEGVSETASELGEAAREQWDDRAPIRREAAGEDPTEDEGDDDRLHLRVERDGVHIGDETLSPSALRRRVRDARRVATELHAILESEDGVPAPDVQRILELLREEDVVVDER